ncbi:MAG: bifunctional lysylphosphatidylglycerol flippase/synthetase MprF, partial [Planctomycetales bacterium]|nr:bifunctional lysylphosphatidylglycerol flippase/synthetase MprF [Planctomycetales bacterium]
EPPAVVGALLAFRLIYYLVPLSTGVVLLGVSELLAHHHTARRAFASLRTWTAPIAPRVMAFSVFLAGVILLFSGATPPAAGRTELLRRAMPLPVIELSHFAGSVIGMLLLILARSLQRRVESAYYLTIALLVGGVITSILKGFDWEEATILATMLAVFLPCRQHFYRKGAMLTERFTPRWMMAIIGVLACTVWLMLFAFKHVEYQHDLWWKFEIAHDAPRSLRGVAGAAVVALAAFSLRVMRARGKLGAMPDQQDFEIARSIVAQSPKTSSHLALLGDKRFLFNRERTAFVMYREAGQSYIAMGDVVGQRAATRELTWDFCEQCDVDGQSPVFYQVDEENVPLYVEIGLTVIKIGEEARVPLTKFGLEGSARKGLRSTHKKLDQLGCSFEVVFPPTVTDLLPTLHAISVAWLAAKNTAEKGFSLGFFKEDYIGQSPIALIRYKGQIVAFANLWIGADKAELSIDLMRYLSTAPHGVMEYLFIKLMLWGQQEGFAWFNLGMAPLAGIDNQSHGPLWNQIAALTYRHGEHFYNFQGLRNYKDKFDPDWTPKYLACSGGFSLPIALANVAALISGGLRGLLGK